MTTLRKRSVCIVLPGLNRLNRGLQPWRYVTETAVQLYRAGHRVTLLSEAGLHALSGINGVPVRSLRSVGQSPWWRNPELEKTIQILKPDVLIWSVELTSFLHQDYRSWSDRPQVGIFSSPIYSAREILRPGLARLLANRRMSGIHLLGAFAPRWLLHARAARLGLDAYITQTQTTCDALASIVQGAPLKAILPGVDALWMDVSTPVNGAREHFGFSKNDFVVLYFGSPSPLRGLPVLVDALSIARRQAANIKLLVLNRRYQQELNHGSISIEKLVVERGLGDSVRILDGLLEPESLVEIVRASDLAALPYELVPTDAPLAVLEAVAARKPVLTSRLACLPELAAQGQAFLAEPGDPESVAKALLEARQQAPVGSAPHLGAVRGWEAVGAEWSDFIQLL